MPPRLASSSLFSSLTFASCSRSQSCSMSRTFSIYRHQCRPYTLRTSKRICDKRFFHASSALGTPKDPYSVLGVKRDATPAEIKKTYFALARKYHPDTNSDKNAQHKFVEIQEAYDTLKDEKKRATYDQYGSASQQPGFDPNFSSGFGGGPSGFSGFQDFASAFGGGASFRSGGSMNGDLFESLFGTRFGAEGGRGRSQVVRGADLDVSLGISFMDACKGATRKVYITPVVDCGTCSGSGLRAGAKRTTCSACGGSGHQVFVIDSGFQMQGTCTSCDGTGSTTPRGSQCSSCSGVGKVRTRKSIDIEIPPGIEDGSAIRIPGSGDAPVSGKGKAGDLIVHINVATSKVFTRQGAQLYHTAKIPMHTALLGGRVRIPTLDGDVDVRVPSGTQQGEEMVLKDRGVPRLKQAGKAGDLFVTFSVVIPRSLTSRQRQLLQAFADDLEGRSSASDPVAKSDAREKREPSPEVNDNDNGAEAEPNNTKEPPLDEETEGKRATA